MVSLAFVSFVPLVSAFYGSKCDNKRKKLMNYQIRFPVGVRLCIFWTRALKAVSFKHSLSQGCIIQTFLVDRMRLVTLVFTFLMFFLVDGLEWSFSWEVASGGLNKSVLQIPFVRRLRQLHRAPFSRFTCHFFHESFFCVEAFKVLKKCLKRVKSA